MITQVYVEGHNCCFWAKNTDRISQVGYVGAWVGTALAIITILGGVLILLAQKGCPLGAINSIAHKIPSSWIYTSWFVASTLFLFCVGFLTAINQKTQEQIYTPQEVEEMGLLRNIKETMPTPIQPLRYTIFNSPPYYESNGQLRPPVYAIMKQDDDHVRSLVAYKTEEALISYIDNLHQKGYQPEDESIWESRDSYTLEHIYPHVDPDKLKRVCQRLGRDLKNGFFNWEEILIPTWGITCLLYVWNEGGESHFIVKKFDAHPGTKGKEYFPDLIYYRAALTEVNKERGHQLNRVLVENDYFTYSVCLEGKIIYAIAFKRYDSMTIETDFFVSEEERNMRLEELGFEPIAYPPE